MPDYFLAPSLVKLRSEINAAFPNRDKASDGWIGDPSHQARKSEHNPCWNCTGSSYGVVRAIDVDIDDRDERYDLRALLVATAITDHRVWYVISNGIIRSRTYGFEPRRYTGPNGHFKHVHISLREGQQFYFDTSTWELMPAGGDRTLNVWCLNQGAKGTPMRTTDSCWHDVRQFLTSASPKGLGVIPWTTWAAHKDPTKTWSERGDYVEFAIRRWQAAAGIQQDGIVGPETAAAIRRLAGYHMIGL